MENEENRGLIDKNSSKDQCVGLVSEGLVGVRLVNLAL